MNKTLAVAALLGALLGPPALAAQTGPDSIAAQDAQAEPDTFAAPPVAAGHAAKADDRSDKVPRRIPMVSLALSAAFPGGGQLYTQKYYRAALFGGAIGYCGYRWYDADRQANKLYALSSQATNLADSAYYFNAYLDQVDNNRRSWMLWTVTVWLFSLADAYVDAHMFKFDERAQEPVIGLRATPSSLALSATF
jgi:hypothetical protein